MTFVLERGVARAVDHLKRKVASSKKDLPKSLLDRLPAFHEGEVILVSGRRHRFLSKGREHCYAAIKNKYLVLQDLESRITRKVICLPYFALRPSASDLRLVLESDKEKLTLEFKSTSELFNWVEKMRLASNYKAPKSGDFSLLKELGRGHFGRVQLAKQHGLRSLVALKEVSLRDSSSLDERVLLEKVTRLRMQNSGLGLPILYSAFVEEDALVFVSEAYLGGTLYDLLREKGRLSVDAVRFIAGEIVHTISELHRIGIAHRDIKPENIIIDSSGHVRLVDFGLAREFRRLESSAHADTVIPRYERVFDIVGTAYYQPPEMIGGYGHTLSVDWWQVGCLVYELLVGSPPFLGLSKADLARKIVSSEPVVFPVDCHVPIDAQEFITALLLREPTDRLGHVGGGSEVKSHVFFNSLNFVELEKGLLEPPEFLKSWAEQHEQAILNEDTLNAKPKMLNGSFVTELNGLRSGGVEEAAIAKQLLGIDFVLVQG